MYYNEAYFSHLETAIPGAQHLIAYSYYLIMTLVFLADGVFRFGLVMILSCIKF